MLDVGIPRTDDNEGVAPSTLHVAEQSGTARAASIKNYTP